MIRTTLLVLGLLLAPLAARAQQATPPPAPDTLGAWLDSVNRAALQAAARRDSASVPVCPMPVARTDSARAMPMPTARADSARRDRMPIAKPRCRPAVRPPRG